MYLDIKYKSDSAFYFAKKSIALNPKMMYDQKVMMSNYMVLGRVYKQKKDYENSIINLHKALQIAKSQGVVLSIKDIYIDLEEIYKNKK